MAVAALKIRVMPDSPDADIEKIKADCEKAIKEINVLIHSVDIVDIAFGLKAIIFTLVWPEDKEQEIIEEKLRKIENVQSAEIVDFRRAIG